MSVEAETTQALSRSVLVMDASRRVGWARAFEAEAKLDDALFDSNVARSDRDAFQRSMSYMFGLFTAASGASPGRVVLMRRILEGLDGLDCLLDEQHVQRGHRKGSKLADIDEACREEAELKLRMKEQRKAESEKLYKAARSSEERRIAARYGFETTTEMNTVLKKYMVAMGRQPIDVKVVGHGRRRKRST